MSKIEIVKGEITKEEVDAIVNAANNSLLGGGGVDGAIHNAAGPELLEYCKIIAPCETGDAKLTPGFNLAAKYVIHTVGPVWQGGESNEASLLSSCYRNSLELADKNEIKTIAFPAISCGVYGYPHEEAALLSLYTIINYLNESDKIEVVKMVLFDDELYNVYDNKLKEILEDESEE